MEVKSRYDISHLIGQKFNRLTVKEDVGIHKHGRKVTAICECGKEGSYYVSFIKNGHTKSCGCLNRERQLENKEKMTKHGLVKHPLYGVWRKIISRCHSKTSDRYKFYGAKGVVVCDQWRNDFNSFYEWAIDNGWKIGMEIDKDKLSPTKPGKIYSPEFCSILTHKENLMNKSTNLNVLYKNEIKPLKKWCDELNLSYTGVFQRIKSGVSVQAAFEIPMGQRSMKKFKIN